MSRFSWQKYALRWAEEAAGSCREPLVNLLVLREMSQGFSPGGEARGAVNALAEECIP